MPLMLLEQEAWVRDERTIDGVKHFWRNIQSDPRTATTLWKWLSGRRKWHRHFAAIIFETRPHHWPAYLYIELPPDFGTDWIRNLFLGTESYDADSLLRIEAAHRQGLRGDLKLTIQDESILGKVVQSLLAAGFKTWDRMDEKFELVFPSPIDAGLIQWVTPLYRTNQQFKQRRERTQDDD